VRIAHLADIHLTSRHNDAQETLDEQVERLLWIGDDAVKNGAEAILVAGDFFDRAHGSTPAERNAAIDVVVRWALRLPVVIVTGNHDAPGDLYFLAELSVDKSVRVFDRPNCIHGACGIVCLPWPRKANLVAQMGRVDRNEIDNVARAAVQAILGGFRARFDGSNEPRILLAHAELGAAYGGTHDYDDPGQPMVGRCDIELSAGDLLDTGADAILLGHIHRHQVINERIVYAGSVRQTTFGEDARKGYCLIDVERGEHPVIEHRVAPGRKLVTVEAEYLVEGIMVDKTPDQIPADAIVRVSYDVSESERGAAAEALAQYANVALEGRAVKFNPRVKAPSRVRSKEMSVATSNTERLEAWWRSREVGPPRADEIKSKLTQLEEGF
jgi:exonuclease SbcD